MRLINLKASDEIAAVSKVGIEEVMEEATATDNGTESNGAQKTDGSEIEPNM